MTTLTVARRFRGPPDSANGGYISGLVAKLAAQRVTVRLMKPPPLDTELRIAERDGVLEVRHGEDAIAAARPGGVGGLAVPQCPSPKQAQDSARRYAGFLRHPAPTCFVCGPERVPGDALRIFPGAVELGHPGDTLEASIVAAPWTPDASLDDGDGRVGLEFMWAALDCPGFIAVARDMRGMLLGELTAEVERRVRVGEPCTVIGWKIASNGRKHEAGTAVFDSGGELCARGRAVWIEPRSP